MIFITLSHFSDFDLITNYTGLGKIYVGQRKF